MPLGANTFWIKFAGVFILLAGVYAAGYKTATTHYKGIIAETRAEHLEAVAEANRKTREVNEANRLAADAAAEAEALRNREREVVEKEVIKEVIKYVETDNARECGLSPSGVLLHDTAARGRLPGDTDAPAITDDGAIEATNAEVILTVTQNYLSCNETIDRLTSLQDWARALRTVE